MSVGGTTALDEFSHLSTSSHNVPDFGSYFNAPEPTESDCYILENRVLPITNSFDLNFDHMVGDNDGVFDDFNINDFLHHQDDIAQPAPEVQPSDELAETTASLQPQFGASTYGCDDGGNAISV